MRTLMFGWEFPPFISGGLGVACYGITKGLLENDVEVIFVLPSKEGNEVSEQLRVIGADEIPLSGNAEKLLAELKTIDVNKEYSFTPYITSIQGCDYTDNFFNKFGKGLRRSILNFTINYGVNLLSEIKQYAIVGESLGQTENFDIIHVHDWLTFEAGIRVKKTTGRPLIAHVHSTEIDRSGAYVNQDVYRIEKNGMEFADKIIAVSFYTKDIITNHYGINSDKIEVVHNAVNKDKQLEKNRIKKNLNEKIVLFLGRITMQKGPDYFIEAATLVLKKIQNVRFVMAGSGDLMPDMISRMAERKIADRFHFTGFLRGADVERMYAMSDLYVMPSVSEPFGLAPFEALLYDVPIIISRQSGASEILKHAVCVDFWDVEKLAENIIALLESEELSHKIVDDCREEMENLEWDIAGEKIKNIYSRVIREQA